MRQAITSFIVIGITLLFVQWLVHQLSPIQPLTARDYLSTLVEAIVGTALAKKLGQQERER